MAKFDASTCHPSFKTKEQIPSYERKRGVGHKELKSKRLNINQIKTRIQISIFLVHMTRELFIHGKAMLPYVQLSTNCRVGFWYNENKICTGIKLLSPQLVDNYTYAYTEFPAMNQGSRLCTIYKNSDTAIRSNQGITVTHWYVICSRN